MKSAWPVAMQPGPNWLIAQLMLQHHGWVQRDAAAIPATTTTAESAAVYFLKEEKKPPSCFWLVSANRGVSMEGAPGCD
eukprot:CAMPEP_0202856930 /NCGR_PEP_ID=MMETSP1391-20130828/45_1 /ASSEMBLY_ACC=CAM_ASM_000867 /TAXON_ID=1034604 /ORGANISM="Chlamydomonas leiostraca, Strain SAG 11-49" /LENGTH=78 /DNA_ID=CAMNT_0049535649 /DNA_START=446 /DNA_END=680 /DNA_ORIENTATION=+